MGRAHALPLPRASVDAVLSNEAISHYSDVDGFLAESARVLRPGGMLVISDGNNGANPGIRAWTEGLWERCENGPAGAYGHHAIDTPYRERRERLLRQRFPDLPPDRLAELARATTGFAHPRLEEVVAAHLAGGPAPDSHYRHGMLPVEPEHDEVMERLFDPPALAADIEQHGFEARAIPHYGGARGGLVAAANAVLSRLPSFRFARGFRIVARRRR
jgi:SAM-dependent methyltransferase